MKGTLASMGAIQILSIGALLLRAVRPSKRVRVIARIALVALAMASFAIGYGRHVTGAVRSPYGEVDVLGVFHYYIGAKYFSELTYTSLYACISAADLEETAVPLRPGAKVRDLATYDFVSREELAACPRERFSAERWANFKNDVGILAGLGPPGLVPYVLTDKGFNPPPSWGVVASWLANRVALTSAAAKFVFNLDLLFAFMALLIIGWACNLESASLAAILMFLFFGNYGRITGNFLQYAWLPALVGAMVWWKEGRYVRSGLAWALATMLQAFPLVLAGVIGLQFLAAVTRRDARSLGQGKFLGVYAAGLAIGVGMGCLSDHGLGAWLDWARKIRLHERYLVGEWFDIGARNLIATAISPDRGTLPYYYYPEVHEGVLARIRAAQSVQWGWALVLVGGFIVLGTETERLTRQAVLSLGFVAAYALLNLSPFYYVSLVAMVAIWPVNGERASLSIQGGLLALNIAQPHFSWLIWRDQLVSELLTACFFVLTAVISVCHRKRVTVAGG